MNELERYEKKEIEALMQGKTIPEFKAGDTVNVLVKVVEGARQRMQSFQGVVIARHNRGLGSTFRVRKVAFGEGVERAFFLYSPNIEIKLERCGRVRRAKLYYLRDRTGKSARIKEIRRPGVQATKKEVQITV